MKQITRLAGILALQVALTCGVTVQAQEPIRIGQTAVLSGPQAPNALAFNQGLHLYFDAVNRAGGVAGRALELVSLDDVYEVEQARENARKLIEDERIVAMIGVTGTGMSMAVAPLVEDAGMALLAPISGAPELRQLGGRQLFHVRATYADELQAMVRYLKVIGITDLGVVYQDDPFGASGLRQLDKIVQDEDVEIVVTAPISGPDFLADDAVATVLNHRPSAVLLVTGGGASIEFIRLSHAADYRPMFLGLSVVSANALAQSLGNDAQGVIVAQVAPHPRSGKYPLIRDMQRLAAEVDVTPDSHMAVEGFMAARVLVEALRRIDGDITRQSITEALAEMGRFNVGGVEVDLAGDGHGERYVDLSMLRADGSFAH